MARWQLWLKTLLPLAVVLVLVVLWLQFTLARSVGQVAVYGQVEHVDLDALQVRALPWLEVPFWRVDLQGLKQSLEQDPWLKSVSIRRQWPNQIRLDLIEREPWALWNEDWLIDTEGKGFNPGFKYHKNLPRHIYSTSSNLADAYKFWQYLDALLKVNDLHLTKIHYESRGAMQLELNASVRVLLGRDNIPLQLNRFIWAWQKWLAQEAEQIVSLDLRYPNGIAVAWRKTAIQP